MSKKETASRRVPGRWRRGLRNAGVVLLALTIIGCAALGLGISRNDVRRLHAFGDAVRRWQSDPEFRQVQREYVAFGVEAMRGRWWGVSGRQVVMGFRSLPGLPLYLRAHGSSADHYRAFSEGELAAYLHLSGEQGIEDGLRIIDGLAQREPLTDADIVDFLSGFKLPVAVATDAGAVESVRRLLADTQRPPRPFAVRGDAVVQALRRHVTPATRTMRQLDDAVRAADPELWRSKQVNDFLGGVWAQAYGRIYLDGIDWLMRIRAAARVVLIVALIALCRLLLRSNRPSLVGVAVADFDDRTLDAREEAK